MTTTIAEPLLLVARHGRVATLTLNRPQRKNALVPALNEAIIAALGELGADAGIGAIIVTGAGGAFSSGLDLKEATTLDPTQAHETAERLFNGLIRAVWTCPKPVIAAVDGASVGFGMALAMACDIRIASERARFAQSFVRIGLIPDGGSTWFLQRLVGPSKAMEMILTGDELDAAGALRLGLVSRVVAPAELESTSRALAERLAQGAGLAHARAKRLVHAAQESSLDQALTDEMSTQMELLRSADFMEGVMAFMTKRPPSFRNQ